MPGAFRRIGPKLHEAYDSLATLVRPSNLVLPAMLSIGAWSLECVVALGHPARLRRVHVPWGCATFFYATSTLAGALVPVPGGLGVTETSLQGQMQELGHVSPTVSTGGDDPRPLRDAVVRGPRRVRGALAAQAPPPVPARRHGSESPEVSAAE